MNLLKINPSPNLQTIVNIWLIYPIHNVDEDSIFMALDIS